VRIISGAKRDLKPMVAEGLFREDLYFRVNVLPIVLPPLRERRDDIPVLLEHFLGRFAGERGIAVPAVSPAVLDALCRYRWPGNVRELENACERMVQTCTCGTVRAGCISSSILFGLSAAEGPRPAASEAPAGPISLDDRLRDVEAGLIKWALKMTGGNKSKAAALLGIKRSTLGDRISRCGTADEQTGVDDDHVPAAPAAV
jgi:DNA-binding NtrC family response regulator